MRAKQANKMNIIKKLIHAPNQEMKAAKLVLTFDPEERLFYVTTLEELHPAK